MKSNIRKKLEDLFADARQMRAKVEDPEHQTFWDGRQNAFKEALEVINGGESAPTPSLKVKRKEGKFHLSDADIGLIDDALEYLLKIYDPEHRANLLSLQSRIALWRDPDGNR